MVDFEGRLAVLRHLLEKNGKVQVGSVWEAEALIKSLGGNPHDREGSYLIRNHGSVVYVVDRDHPSWG